MGDCVACGRGRNSEDIQSLGVGNSCSYVRSELGLRSQYLDNCDHFSLYLLYLGFRLTKSNCKTGKITFKARTLDNMELHLGQATDSLGMR